MTAPRPLYFDCDLGVDDAMALLYLLASPEVDLVGIGTICGNTDAAQVTENVLRFLDLAGRPDIPVAAGEDRYLAAEYGRRPTWVHGENGIGNVDLPATVLAATGESPADMILRLSHEYEGDLEILAVGPFTNLALALAADPSLPSRVRAVTVMGGAALVPGNVTAVAEANIIHDPEAAARVLEASWPVTLVGLDVTMENLLEEADLARLAASDSPTVRAVARMHEVYFDYHVEEFGRRCCALHDPLAAAIAVGTIVPIDSPWVDVVVDDTRGPGRGQTIADLRGYRLGARDVEGATNRMALQTDRPFAAHLLERVLGNE